MLKETGKIYILQNSEMMQLVLYARDPRVPIQAVDRDISDLFHAVELPKEAVDLERELRKAGSKPLCTVASMMQSGLKRGTAGRAVVGKDGKKKRREVKRKKLTNMHLPDLFQGPS
eukprot:jgi/Mesvir1/4015/Mv03707-RA.1